MGKCSIVMTSTKACERFLCVNIVLQQICLNRGNFIKLFRTREKTFALTLTVSHNTMVCM